MTGAPYSLAALFKAFANKPLVPPPAQRTRTFVCSLISLVTPAFSRIASAFAVLKLAATFFFFFSDDLPERSFYKISSS